MSKMFKSRSTLQGFLEGSATSTARAFVSSASGLSCIQGLSFELDRQNCERVSTLLLDLDYTIKAVWVVKRPINYDENTKFEHWTLKIQAPPVLISLDFLEHNKKGAFGLELTTGMNAELSDFLYYYQMDNNGNRHRKKWEIISAVVPSPFKKDHKQYSRFVDYGDFKLLQEIQKTNNIPQNSPFRNLKDIECDKKVTDIADFLEEFTTEYSGYNAVMNNCQHFVFKLYKYILGDKYKSKWKFVASKLQTPYKDKSINQSLIDDDAKVNNNKANNNNGNNNIKQKPKIKQPNGNNIDNNGSMGNKPNVNGSNSSSIHNGNGNVNNNGKIKNGNKKKYKQRNELNHENKIQKKTAMV